MKALCEIAAAAAAVVIHYAGLEVGKKKYQYAPFPPPPLSLPFHSLPLLPPCPPSP